jgi:hypothetical protein
MSACNVLLQFAYLTSVCPSLKLNSHDSVLTEQWLAIQRRSDRREFPRVYHSLEAIGYKALFPFVWVCFRVSGLEWLSLCLEWTIRQLRKFCPHWVKILSLASAQSNSC